MKILISVVMLFLLIGCSDTPEEKRMKELKQQVAKEKLQQTTAILMAQKFVKINLKAPTTAIFQDVFEADHEWMRKNRDENTSYHKITSYVDSQNSFGAMIRTHYVVIITYDKKKETFALKEIKIK